MGAISARYLWDSSSHFHAVVPLTKYTVRPFVSSIFSLFPFSSSFSVETREKRIPMSSSGISARNGEMLLLVIKVKVREARLERL